MRNRILPLIFLLTILPLCTVAQEQLSLDQIATDSIRKATTEERFITQWVDSLPEHPSVPSP
ncbi:MAG: hypothetical protein OXE78_01260, partial [Gammaproteobacteria bacterium]|nr:hypothetical protein [Gammaproteobacteria bacterium]